MMLLALETSSPIGTVALAAGGGIIERSIPTPREQTEQMLPLVDELLAEAGIRLTGLDAIVFGRGPGSFTGLRISAALAQGLAMAADRPIVAVSSLEALAQRAWRELGAARSLACIDARMGEVYSAAYAVGDGIAGPLDQERLTPPGDVETPPAWAGDTHWCAVGSGWTSQGDALAALLGRAAALAADLVPAARDLLPRARHKLEAGEIEPPEGALPVYLRNASAWHR
jgi:tRNA threonylcarbamoyladenosine biosynthesis protein TsaB